MQESKGTAELAGLALRGKKRCAHCGSFTHVTGQCPKKDHGVVNKRTITSEAKEEEGRSDYGKASVRNKRAFGIEGEPEAISGSKERGKMIDVRRYKHRTKRGIKKGDYKIDEGKGYQPEIEHIKGSDLLKKKKKVDLPPHLRLDVMKKAFAHTNKVSEGKVATGPRLGEPREKGATHPNAGEGEKIQKRTLKWMRERGIPGSPGVQAMKDREAEHRARNKSRVSEAYRVLARDKDDKGRPAQFSYKDEDLANKFADSVRSKGGKATVSKEGVGDNVMKIVNKYRKKQKAEKKPSMDSTTSKLHTLRKEKFKTDKQKEHEKYVNFLDADD